MSESEGELKRRIHEHVSDDSFFDGEDDVPVYNHKAVDKILDEAKKEFPKGSFYTKDGKTLVLSNATIKRILDIEEWFKRWFGEEKNSYILM